MIFVYVLLILSISNSLEDSTPINMLTLSKHWYGLGDSLLFTGLLKILPEQLQKKSGMMTSAAEINAGQNWEVTYVMNFNCMKERPPGAVAMWLQKNPVVFLQRDYTHENAKYLFGQVGPIEGFMMLFFHNSIRIGFVNPQMMNRDTLIYNTKVCKQNLDKDGNVKLKIKYTEGKIVGFYIVENDREELCVQFDNINFLDRYHLGFSGSDDGASCSAEVKELSLRSEVDHQIIPQKDKQIGDAQFAYFDNLDADQRRQEFEMYQRNFQIYKEKSQILANELMQFSIMDPDDISKKTKSNIQSSIEKIDGFLDVIDLEAQQMQQYSQILESEKQKGDQDALEVVQKILGFLDQTEEIFKKVSKSTEYIYKALDNIGTKNDLKQMNKRAQNLYQNLKNTKVTLGRAQEIMKPLDKLEKSKIKVIKNWVKQNMGGSKKQNKKNKKTYTSNIITARNLALFLLGGFGCSILLGFGYMYYKVKKQIQHKRII